MQKLNIAVLFGGCSSEYSVSLQSAHAVITHMNREKYNPVLLGITQSGEWFHFRGNADKILADEWHAPKDCSPAIISPSRDVHGVVVFGEEGTRTIRLDAAMPVLHGKNGEDGTVQGLMELAGIPVVGCGALASALCMDKDRAHKLAQLAGVQAPRSFVLRKGAAYFAAVRQAQALCYPLFVKPVRAGSSFGITKVTGPDDLSQALDLAFCHDDEVIMEENIIGVEVGCAVMGNEEPFTGEVDEIELSSGFFDYEEKYTLKTSAIHVPARITPEKAVEVKEAAKTIYRALGCRVFARVDLFLTPAGDIYFNEVNTIPGFTAHSRFPSMMKAAGMDFAQVIDTVIGLAVER